MTFQIGDVVQLRYGGSHHMRVENAVFSEGSEWITCVWGANMYGPAVRCKTEFQDRRT
jgi:uncharacterized protein YodC (DUF2158 family)